MAFALVTFDLGAQRADQRAAPSNFDVRTTRDPVASAYMARSQLVRRSRSAADLAGTRAAGLARLQSDVGAVDVVTNPELGTPEVVSRTPGGGFLTAPTADRAGAMRAFLSAYADVYGLLPGQAESLELVADYANPAGNMAWVEFEQRINGLPVFRGLIRGGFTAGASWRGRPASLAAGLEAAQLATAPALTAAQAVSRAAATVGWSVDGGRRWCRRPSTTAA